MNCRDRDLVETTIFRVVETEICRDWPKIVEIEIFPRLSLISAPNFIVIFAQIWREGGGGSVARNSYLGEYQVVLYIWLCLVKKKKIDLVKTKS